MLFLGLSAVIGAVVYSDKEKKKMVKICNNIKINQLFKYFPFIFSTIILLKADINDRLR